MSLRKWEFRSKNTRYVASVSLCCAFQHLPKHEWKWLVQKCPQHHQRSLFPFCATIWTVHLGPIAVLPSLSSHTKVQSDAITRVQTLLHSSPSNWRPWDSRINKLAWKIVTHKRLEWFGHSNKDVAFIKLSRYRRSLWTHNNQHRSHQLRTKIGKLTQSKWVRIVFAHLLTVPPYEHASWLTLQKCTLLGQKKGHILHFIVGDNR